MLSKYLTVALAALVAGAQAQSLLSDPNIDIPSSSMPQPPGIMRTHYYRLAGPWQGRPGDDLPILAMHGPFLTNPSGYHPADIRNAYQLPSTALGSGAIALVDAYNLPTALNDFNVFANQFSLPVETSTNPTASTNKVFQIAYPSGTVPANNAGWGGEIALDIEWAHALAPNAKIYLVEAASASGTDLFAAAKYASTLPGVKEISMSWGGGEGQGESTFDTYFQNNGVVYFASAGDSGGQQEYPSESAYVVGVGGTSLHMSGSTVSSETAWSGSGGGPSSQISRPTFQNGISSIVGSMRGAPDVSLVADPNTGVAVYDSTPDQGYQGWFVVGGTSLASPATAAITNLRGRFSNTTTDELNRIYANYGQSTIYRDITSGSAGSYSAKVGWDYITGVGASIGLLPSLSSLTLDNSSVTAGGTVHLTAKIATALAKAITVTVTSSNTSVISSPQTITIAAGSTSGSVALTTPSSVASTTSLTLTGDYEGSDLSASLTVNPVGNRVTISSATLTPSSLTGGATSVLKLTFSAAAKAATTVNVTSSNTTIVPNVGSVSVPVNATSVSVNVPTVLFSTGAQQSVTITATAANSATATLTVLPFAVSTLKLTKTDLAEGDTNVITVTTSAAAPSAQTISVTSDTTASIPSFTVSIAKGASTGTATVPSIKTYLAATKTVNLSTSLGVKVTTSENLHPLVTTFVVSPTTLKGGVTATCLISFYKVLGAGTVTLPAVSGINYPATAPSYSATATSVDFKITAAKVTANKTYTLTAKLAGYTRTCTITVTP